MARKVFFSFHYQDVIDFRANVVRNHWVTKDRQEAGYFDKSVWESAKQQGDANLKRLINGALDGTSNTCVLIGTETHARPWVRYEILKSFARGSHLFGVHINGIADKYKRTKSPGTNPFAEVGVAFSQDGRTATLYEYLGSKWVEYDRIGGSSEIPFDCIDSYKGTGHNLASWVPTYDWNTDDGYNKFANWVQ